MIARSQRALIVKVPFFSPSLETLTSVDRELSILYIDRFLNFIYIFCTAQILRFTGSLIALATSII